VKDNCVFHTRLAVHKVYTKVGFCGRDRNAARATLGEGLSVSAFPRYVPV
jgi:hypothetical protein